MRILILGNKETLPEDPQYYEKYVAFVRETTPGNPQEVDHILFDDLFIAVGPRKLTIRSLSLGRDLSDYQVILARGRHFKRYIDILKTLSIYAAEHGITFINEYTEYRTGSKLDQAVTFYEANVAAPSTVVVTPGLIEHKPELPGINFPCIMKSTFGAHGKNNHLVHDWQQIHAVQKASPNVRFLLQQFIPNDGDYRLLIVGDDMVAIKRRAAAGLHLNNTSQGGTATLVPLQNVPQTVQDDAWRLVRTLHKVTAGIDVIQDAATGKYYVLEVNSQPQLVTGAFLDIKTELFRKYLRGLEA